nr:MAG TPA: hypothetical protein [Caudoviricetes sp.]
MAFFGGHDTEDINVTLENSAKYECEAGLGLIALECTQFEAEIFGECVRSDMKEFALVQEGADVEAFQEASWESVKTKVVNFVKKVWAKVKAFFNGWYAKIAARLMSDNKAFYNKFKKSLDSKDLSKLEVKYEAPKTLDVKVVEFSTLLTDNKFKDSDASDVIEACYEGITASSHAEAKKEIMEKSFDDEDEVKYTSIASTIENELSTSKAVKEAQKEYNKTEKKLAKTISDLQKEHKGTENIAIIANAHSKANVTLLEAKLAVAKKTASQARRVFAKAVAYSPKTEGAFDADLLAVEADALMA